MVDRPVLGTDDAPVGGRVEIVGGEQGRGRALAAVGGLSACSTSSGAGGNKDLITAVIGYGNDQSWDPTQTASAWP